MGNDRNRENKYFKNVFEENQFEDIPPA